MYDSPDILYYQCLWLPYPGYQNTWRNSKQSWRTCTKHLVARKPTSLLIPWVEFLWNHFWLFTMMYDDFVHFFATCFSMLNAFLPQWLGVLISGFFGGLFWVQFFEQYVNSWIAVAAPFQGQSPYTFVHYCFVERGVPFSLLKLWQKKLIIWWAGAPGFIMDCLLTGVEFVKGWQRQLFVAKWSMHQLVWIWSPLCR